MPDPQCRPERTTKYSRGKRYLDNLEIHVCNIPYDGLPFEDNTFDFVQQNLSAIVYTRSDWSRMLAELIRVTKPGGYIQLMEVDYYIHHCRLEQDVWLEKVLRSIEDHFHVQPHIARQLDTLLKEAGMTEVDGRLVSIPFGAWGLDIGILWQQNVDNVVEAMKPFLSSLLNMDGSTYRDKWRATVDELEHAKAFHNVHISWGRKPFPQE
ncbi:uncharacterized protein BYT42DRAFT_506332 [Radiomyces spectabilis]|uniref:uncharacterized protein n=1 Tax=Radiomyces spectabilis TaxID=64574 RepID=UPI0022211167|nr:uncharacterized protein BYT42DRAFT_506332 [Radiomyces spectabilis]KAI8364358.1 hypothetical protein BYT42DRAFT_506332 [Radiomyces spectabilis]